MLAITVVWTVSALLITGIILTTLYEKASQRDFRDILLAHTYGVMGAIDVASDGSLTGQPNLGDPRFLTPLSGWHWSVSEAKNPQKLLLFSPSISGEATQIPSTQNVGFDESFRRTFELDGQQYLESQLFLGEKDILYVVSIAASRQGLVRNVSNFRNSLFLFLSVFGFGTIIATYVVIVLGLRPLRQAQEKLSEVREGKADKIEGVYPEEVQPLVDEINALINSNLLVMERARTQVGNLAHGLKTPLAVILNETSQAQSGKLAIVTEQANSMKNQIQTYLNRARIAAGASAISSRTSVPEVLNKIKRVLSKLNPDVEIIAKIDQGAEFFGEKQDLEEILGNLIENAVRFANSRVEIKLNRGSNIAGKNSFLLTVNDDGEGVSEKQMQAMVKRGIRLDETTPGSGLGLSIVTDIVGEYGGSLKLSRSELGGLCAQVTLPGNPQ